MRKARFIGGPVDGGTIKLDDSYTAYHIPIRPEPHVITPVPDGAVTEVSKLLCYVYERRGDCLIYTGEALR